MTAGGPRDLAAGHRPALDEPVRDAAAAERFLLGLVRAEPRAYAERERHGLASVRDLLARAGHPERGLDVVHVAGSKGKGTTVLLLEALLLAAGRRPGVFTSPHLERWTERFRVGGAEIGAPLLAAACERLRGPVRDRWRRDPDRAPSFFDVLTAAAFVVFREQGADCAVLECGLGGRLDATNAVAKRAAAITAIELEHTDKLGPTLAHVAREKAGILARGVPAVVAPLPGPAEAEVERVARARGAALLRLGREIPYEPHAGTDAGAGGFRVALAGRTVEVALERRRAWAASDAACALALAVHSGLAPPEAIAAGAARVVARTPLPGRVEVLGERPWTIADGSHTAASIAVLEAALRDLPAAPAGHRELVVSVSGGRDAAALLAPLLPGATRVVATCAEPSRSLPAATLAAALARAGSPAAVACEPDPERALRAARARLPIDGVLVATGSMYMAGAARRVLGTG